MISLDQVLLLQKKVETAVEKIKALSAENAQLKSDNDALRRTCAELTKAVSDKSELVSSMEFEQDKIEETILNTLNQLDTVENALLAAASSQLESEADSPSSESQVSQENTQASESPILSEENEVALSTQEQALGQDSGNFEQTPSEPIFEEQNNSFQENVQVQDTTGFQNQQEVQEQPSEQNNNFEGQFDIF